MELIKPMEPILKKNVTAGKQWIHQIKWDGVRAITYIQNDKVKIFTKKGRERTLFYPELHQLNKLLGANEAILDGEMIVLDSGKPTFNKILVRERVINLNMLKYYSKNYPVNYIVFDILSLNGEDMRNQTFAERKKVLINNLNQNAIVAITDDYEDGEKLMQLIRTKGWEGIVSKKIDSKYIAGKNHQDWFKTKIKKQILAIVCGIQFNNNYPNALLLGIYRNKMLQYIGKASVGLKQNDIYELKKNMILIEENTSPFPGNKKFKNVEWLKPKLTCIVQFMEWTDDLHLRQPIIIGFSSLNPYTADGRELTI